MTVVYVKVIGDNNIYYVEAATNMYGNEKLLVNKQMVKTGFDDTPKIYGLKDAIKKQQTEDEFLSDLNKVRKAYAQSEYHNQSAKNSIPQNTEESQEKYSVGTEYMELAQNPEKNNTALKNMVGNAAYDSGLRFVGLHGTPYFGFTKIEKGKPRFLFEKESRFLYAW